MNKIYLALMMVMVAFIFSLIYWLKPTDNAKDIMIINDEYKLFKYSMSDKITNIENSKHIVEVNNKVDNNATIKNKHLI